MRLELTGRHVDISPALRRLVERKIAKLERLLDHRAISAQVVLSREKLAYRAECTLHARGERFLHGVGQAATWEPALTRAAAKIEQQAQKVKGKWAARIRAARPSDAEEAPTIASAPTPTAIPKARMPKLLRTARQTVRTLLVSEAARLLDAARDELVVFREAESGRVAVLYRSAAGELTLVETEA
jgi:putative sigma-54 modulation protein